MTDVNDINYLLSELQNVLNEATDSDYAEGLVESIEKYKNQNEYHIDQSLLTKIHKFLRYYENTTFNITEHVESGYYKY
jgi:hypothetical protein